MKKIIVIPLLLGTFALGIVLSDLVIQGINAALGTELSTKAQLEKKLALAGEERAQIQNKMAETSQQADALRREHDQLKQQTTEREANLNSLINDMNTNVNPALIKDILLSTPTSRVEGKGKIFLNPAGTESLLEPTTSDDPIVNEFQDTFNKKAKEILDVSKGILGEKIGQLNQELVRRNDELADKNVALIKKMREEEHYKEQIGQLNTQLQQTNEELKDKNTKLTEKLEEVEKYKKELEEHKKYINDLEGIKGDLQKTVGVLETKIENGRLKVRFEGDILFESGKHELKKEGKDLLESVFSILRKSVAQNDIFIAGHTDNVPIRAESRDRYESNWVLSTYRAIEVVKYLVEKGIPPQGVTAAGYGEYKPIADNTTPEGRTINRRVELFLIPRIIKR